MRLLLLGIIFGVLAATITPDVNADAVSDVNRGLDSAERTMQGVESTTERSKNLFDRIKGWFEKHNKNAQPNPTVREVQQRLLALGYNPGPVDGVVGPQTLDAIVRFQQARGLPVDARVTPELAQLLRSITVVAPTPIPPSPPQVKQSEADILIALQYSTGADVHHLRCSGGRNPQFRDEFLRALTPERMMQYAGTYDDEFVRQYESLTDCQPQVAKWLAERHQQRIALLNPSAAPSMTSSMANQPAATNTGGQNVAPVLIPPSTASSTVTPAAHTDTSKTIPVDGPPLSSPESSLSSNLALNTTTVATSPATTTEIDPSVVGAWAWIHPQQGIIAFVNMNDDNSYTMESLGAEVKRGKVETSDGMLRLLAQDPGDSSEYHYQLANPDEINLIDAAGEQTVLLRNKIQ